MAKAFLRWAIAGWARSDGASANVADARTRRRRPGVRAICDG